MTSTSSSTPQLPVGSQGQPITVIGNKYRLSRRLGGGSFGDIYLGEYIPTGEKVRAWMDLKGGRMGSASTGMEPGSVAVHNFGH